MLHFRVLTAIIGIPVLIALDHFAGLPLFIAVMITALIGMDEIIQALRRLDIDFINWVGYLGTFMFIISGNFLGEAFFPKTFLAFLLIVVSFYVIYFPRISFSGLSTTFFSSIYIGYCFSFVFFLRSGENGFFFLLLAFILSWATDIGGYVAGRLWGKRKLAESLSPNKTREGAVGSLVFPMGIAVFAFNFSAVSATFLEAAVLGLLAGLIGQIGDLSASALKRQSGIKDFGNLLPGHGGILDRFDSFLLIAPLVYYYLGLFIID